MSFSDVALGIGYRTVRNANRRLSFQIGGGFVSESATIQPNLPDLTDQSDSRTGAFGRIAIEGRHTALWIEHGFGFEDENEESPIVWSDSWIVGLTWSFH